MYDETSVDSRLRPSSFFAATVVSLGLLMHSPAMGGDTYCDFAATVELANGGAIVHLQVGGAEPWDCTPTNPQVSVDGDVITLTLCTPTCSCGWSATEWCEQASTDVLPPGTYQVVVEVYEKPCFAQLCNELLYASGYGTVTIPAPGPIGDDFNDGATDGWDLDAFPCGIVSPSNGGLQITDDCAGELCSVGVALSTSAMAPADFRDGTARVRVNCNPVCQSSSSVTIGMRGDPVLPYVSASRFTLNYGAQEASIFGGSDFQSVRLELVPYTDYMLEATAIGDQLALKAWPVSWAEPATPQLTLTDDTYQSGVLFLSLQHADALFDDFTFTPHGWELLDDFAAGYTGNWTGCCCNAQITDGRLVFPPGPTYCAVGYDPSFAGLLHSNGRIRATITVGEGDQAYLSMREGLYGGYRATFDAADGMLRLEFSSDVGAQKDLGSAATPFGGMQDLYLELGAVGDQITAKVWAVGEPEPVAPQVIATDDFIGPDGDINGQAGLMLGAFSPQGWAQLHAEFGDIWFQSIEPAGTTGDLDGNGVVDAGDLALLLGAWGSCNGSRPCAADLDSDGDVDAADLGVLLGNWG